MRNKIVIPENSRLKPSDKIRALEVLATYPFDLLSIFPENPNLLVYPKLELDTPNRKHQRIGFSKLTPLIKSPFYQVNFYGPSHYQAEPLLSHDANGRRVFTHTIYNGPRRIGKISHSEFWQRNQHYLDKYPASFTFILICPAHQLLGPDGKPLFPELSS